MWPPSSGSFELTQKQDRQARCGGGLERQQRGPVHDARRRRSASLPAPPLAAPRAARAGVALESDPTIFERTKAAAGVGAAASSVVARTSAGPWRIAPR